MTIQDHLKIASSEMMKAANAVRQEINDLRSEEANLQKLINKDIALLTTQLQMREQEVKSTDDTTYKAQGQTVIDNIVRQIADAKNQLGKDQQRIRDMIREKESLISNIDQQAKTIQP